jgi:hypothetical protein
MVVMVGLCCAEGPDSEDEKNLHQPKHPPDKGLGLKLNTGIGQFQSSLRFVLTVIHYTGSVIDKCFESLESMGPDGSCGSRGERRSTDSWPSERGDLTASYEQNPGQTRQLRLHCLIGQWRSALRMTR